MQHTGVTCHIIRVIFAFACSVHSQFHIFLDVELIEEQKWVYEAAALNKKPHNKRKGKLYHCIKLRQLSFLTK